MADDRPIERRYSNGEITVLWLPALCVHCQACIQGLPEVFNLDKRPWVNIHGATTEQIVQQVNECPSAALSIIQKD